MKKYILPIVITTTGLISMLSDGCSAVPNVPKDTTNVTYELTKASNPSLTAKGAFVAKRSPVEIYKDLLRERGFHDEGKAKEIADLLTDKYKAELLKVKDSCNSYLKDESNKSDAKRKQVKALIAKIDSELNRGYPVAIETALKINDSKHGDYKAAGKGIQTLKDPLGETFQLFLHEDEEKAKAFGENLLKRYCQSIIDAFNTEYASVATVEINKDSPKDKEQK